MTATKKKATKAKATKQNTTTKALKVYAKAVRLLKKAKVARTADTFLDIPIGDTLTYASDVIVVLKYIGVR